MKLMASNLPESLTSIFRLVVKQEHMQWFMTNSESFSPRGSAVELLSINPLARFGRRQLEVNLHFVLNRIYSALGFISTPDLPELPQAISKIADDLSAIWAIQAVAAVEQKQVLVKSTGIESPAPAIGQLPPLSPHKVFGHQLLGSIP